MHINVNDFYILDVTNTKILNAEKLPDCITAEIYNTGLEFGFCHLQIQMD